MKTSFLSLTSCGSSSGSPPWHWFNLQQVLSLPVLLT